LDSPLAAASGATVAYRDLQGGRQEYGVRLALPAPTTPTTLTVQRLATPFEVVVQAVTLIDERTGMFLPLLPSDRGEFRLAHSGDVKIYENLDHLPRAQLAYEIIGVATADEALAALQTAQVTPGQSAVVEGLASFSAQPAPTDGAMIRSYTAERVQIQTRTAGEALLVLGDTAFPGWVATVDGRPAPIYTTNYLFRGVMIPPGEHTVIFEYRPQSWQQGLWLSGVGVAGWLVLVGWALRQRYLPSARAG
jgi:hypothetical protein